MTRFFASLLAGICLLLGAAGGAQAVRTVTDVTHLPMFWTRGCIRMELMSGDPLPQFVTRDLFQTAASAAATGWSTAKDTAGRRCSGMGMSVLLVPRSAFEVDVDNTRSVQFRRDEWSRNTSDASKKEKYPANALAITSVFARTMTGEILDVDVELNATGNFRWGDLVANPGLAQQGAVDLQNTLTHEFGHVLGLDHSCATNSQPELDAPKCDVAPAEAVQSTMYPSVERTDTERRTLTQGDMNDICAVYPASTILACPNVGGGGGEDDGGGCAFRSPAEGREPEGYAATALLALAILLAGSTRAKRRGP